MMAVVPVPSGSAAPLVQHQSVAATSTLAVIKTIGVGDQPYGVAVNDGDDTVYVTNYFSGTVSVINGRTGAEDDTITVTSVTPPAPTIRATMTRDVDRVLAVGSFVGAQTGSTITPWYRFPGDVGYTAVVPVTLDANGGFTWKRSVNRSKTVRVYFTVSGVQSTTLVGQAPKVEVTGSRKGTSLLVTATTVNIASGSTVKPYIKIDGGKAIRGTQLQVAADGTFAWTYIAQKGQQIRVKFNVRGVKSDPVVL